jgi:response regulator RpfG family c-di-GMP phosphodiesterase
MFTLSTIVIDPHPPTRMNLKQALRVLPIFAEIFTVPTIKEAQMQKNIQWDIHFLSHRVSHEEAAEYIATAQMNSREGTGAIILVTSSVGHTETQLAAHISRGFDAILCEPFSVDGINSCIEVALEIKVKGLKNRVKVGISLMLPGVLRAFKGEKTPEGGENSLDKELKSLHEICKILDEVCNFSGQNYKTIIGEVFREISEDKLKNYRGASKRIRDSFDLEEKAYESLKAELLSLK